MIYIVKHKEYDNPIPQGYKELGVGKLFKDTGEDIEHLNPHINEATAYYDLWKNCKDTTIGICHYRRFFAENGEILSKRRAEEILKTTEMIVAKRYKSNHSLYIELKTDLAKGLEEKLYDKYLEMFYEREPMFEYYMKYAKEFYPREMLITSRKVFDEFCGKLFADVLPIAEAYRKEFMTDSEVATKNPRLLGFIVERFFSYTIVANGYKVHEMEIKDI